MSDQDLSELANSKPQGIPDNIPAIVHLLALFGALAAVFLCGGLQQANLGVFLAAAGLSMVVGAAWARPRTSLLLASFALLGTASLSLLADKLFPSLPWRETLASALPFGLPPSVSVTPQSTLFWLAIMACSLMLFAHLLAMPLRTVWMMHLTTILIFVAGVYASLAIYSHYSGWKYPFDTAATFGFFPNRNHAACFLSASLIAALGLFMFSMRAGLRLPASISLLAAVPLLASVGIFSESRAGLLLLALLAPLWLIGIGSDHRSRNTWIVAGSIAALGILFFFVAGGPAKKRIIETAQEATASAGQDVPLDVRILVYRDTLKMIGDRPWTGFGLGSFNPVFRQYRKLSLTQFDCLHPESDWLMLPSEAGVPALVLALLIVGLAVVPLRGSQDEHSWPLRWGLVCAAGVGIVHGIFDVPIHRLALGWTILCIAAAGLSVRQSRPHRPELWKKILIALAGLGSLGLGSLLIAAEFGLYPPFPPFAAAQAIEKGNTLIRDRIADEALDLADQSLKKYPTEQGLCLLKGQALAYFEESEPEMDSVFRAQRLLAPDWPQVPIDQGMVWMQFDPTRTAALWKDALAIQQKVDDVNKKVFPRTPGLRLELLRRAASNATLFGLMKPEPDAPASQWVEWITRAPGDIAWQGIDLLRAEPAKLHSLDLAEAHQLIRIWYHRGDKKLLAEYLADPANPKDRGLWGIRAALLAEAERWEEALKTVQQSTGISVDAEGIHAPQNILPQSPYPDPIAMELRQVREQKNMISYRRLLNEAMGSKDPSVETLSVLAGEQFARGDWQGCWSLLVRFLRKTTLAENLP